MGKRLYSLIGFFLGLGAPLGWLFYRALFSHPGWISKEFSQFGAIYIYMAVGTVTVFTLFGYFLGRRSDNLTQQSDAVKESLKKVNLLAITDALTNVHNARYLHDQLSIEIESARRYNAPLSCLMIDIDDFKKVNDKHGHPFGDMVLSTLAQTFLQCVRRIDVVGRLGGEEFLVVLPHTALDVAVPIAERIRQAVEHWPFSIQDANVTVTISMGVACFPMPGIVDKASLLKAADQALYEAKRTGKNKVVVSKN